jgi:hypothetical protein
VQWRGIGSASTTDWIGLYRPGDANTAPISWQYVGCAEVPLDARPLGSCNVQLPKNAAAGAYEFRLFSEDSYTVLATSSPLRVD